MIYLNKLPLLPTDIDNLKKWVSNPGTIVFGKYINTLAAFHAAQAGNSLAAGDEAGKLDAVEEAEIATVYRLMGDLLEKLASGQENPFRLEIVNKPPNTQEDEQSNS